MIAGLGTVGIIGSVAVLAVLYRLAQRGQRLYRLQKRLAAQRPPARLAAFVCEFESKNIPEILLIQTFALFSREIALVPDFPVASADSLQQVFGIGGDSGTALDEITDALLTRSQLTVLAPCRGAKSVETVADLICWLNTITRPLDPV